MLKLGLTTWFTDYSVSPVDFARAAEDLGFESVFVPDHTHIPVSRLSAYPNGGELPPEYSHGLDPMVVLGLMAATTSRIRLGTAVCLVIERDPIVLAKQVATLDHVSGGRIELGVGAGWNREEMANHGTKFETRWALLRERVQALRTIWSATEAEYHGQHVDFDPIWSWPKPAQPRGVPVLVGGAGPAVIRRVLEYGDGWIPPVGWEQDLFERVERLHEEARLAGRPEPPVTAVGVKPKRDVLAQLDDHGIDRALIAVPVEDRDSSLSRLERYAALLP
jgi:probable F420-dependent oxidoreductase